ncbi:MAG TPA: low-specificity L-threonine aldolase [Arenicellales bacterium]|nr:low-specificity L-threonine aldolase [Arenicellales bacterium]HJP08694.1 low-specificity L-threonine aldolase [Arenicellales bacterium]
MDDLIDLRSDTVTRPSIGMREAMLTAEVGDDVYGEDPTITALEQRTAELFGMAAGLFVTSGTQGNLLALLCHCHRGDEYIAGARAHSYLSEGGGGAVLASIQPQPVENNSDGTIELQKIKDAIKPDDFHYARTRLLCLENTFYGQPLPLSYLEDAAKLGHEYGLALHLDGARIFNAAIKQKVPLEAITRHFDSVSACLSKGLGAPLGAVLCGTDSFVEGARKWRKMVGGGWRQAGIVASAGLYALENNVNRLSDDHDNALLLTKLLNEIDGLNVEQVPNRTNMVFIRVPAQHLQDIQSRFLERGVLITASGNPVRLVTHLDIDEAGVRHTASVFRDIFRTGRPN